jgi:signal peptidase I
VTGAAPDRRPRRRAFLAVAGAAALLLLLQGALFSLCAVDGTSMEPGLLAGERLLVWRHPGRLERGDVVVFTSPLAPDELLVKRVVAVEGERVGSHEGRLAVGGFLLEEPWVKPGTALAPLQVLVPPGCLFVLGDNRAESIDSRQLGPIDRRLVVGRVLCKVWPPGGMGR